jgi:hypothetical protein
MTYLFTFMGFHHQALQSSNKNCWDHFFLFSFSVCVCVCVCVMVLGFELNLLGRGSTTWVTPPASLLGSLITQSREAEWNCPSTSLTEFHNLNVSNWYTCINLLTLLHKPQCWAWRSSLQGQKPNVESIQKHGNYRLRFMRISWFFSNKRNLLHL